MHVWVCLLCSDLRWWRRGKGQERKPQNSGKGGKERRQVMGTDHMWQSYRRAGHHLLCCLHVHGSPLQSSFGKYFFDQLSCPRICVGCCELMMDKALHVLELVFQQGRRTDR